MLGVARLGHQALRPALRRISKQPLVYLAVHPEPRSRQEVAQGYVSLGKLKGNIGAQNYEIPARTDMAKYRSVVIYCQPFHVVFATATLQAAP